MAAMLTTPSIVASFCLGESMESTIEVASQFQGPPGSGNGGYVSGLLAKLVNPLAAAPGVEVTLRAPTPLDVTITAFADDSGAVAKLDELLIAQALPLAEELALDIPQPPTFEQALAAQSHSAALDPTIENVLSDGLGFHPVCFCCGADVPIGKGLRVFASPVRGFVGVAAAWQPHPAFADEQGMLPKEILWAALDCPGQFAFLAADIRTGLLGRMTARLVQPVLASDQIVITGWCIAIEGKKHFAGTALFNQRGECCAYAKQVWIGRRN